MEYQKIINLANDTTNQPSRFRTKNWVEINEESEGRYENRNIRFKTTTIRSSLCDYSDLYILAKGNIIVPNTAATGATVNNTNREVILKNCASITDCITEIINIQVDDAQNIDAVMPMYNLIEYSDVYSKTSESLWQNYWDEPALNKSGDANDFPENKNNTNLFKVKQQIAGQTGNVGTKDAEIMVPLRYLSNFWRTLEMSSINCEISFGLKWPRKCIIVAGTANNQNPTFQINDTKLYIAVVT